MRPTLLALWLALSCCAFSQAPVVLKDINPLTTDVNSHSYPLDGKVFNGALYFTATNHNGRELWKTSGTSAGTTLVKDIFSLSDYSDANPQFLRIIGNNLYFFTQDGILYKLDGTTGNITGLFKMNELPVDVAVLNNKLYISAEYDVQQGTELIEIDPSIPDFTPIADINQGIAGSIPQNFTVIGSKLFFTADDGEHGRELWVYDEPTETLTMVKDLSPGLNGSNPFDLIAYNGLLYFTANDGDSGFEIWSTDGDPANTVLLKDINANAGIGSFPDHKTVFNGNLYFSADDGNGVELWKSNGTEAGTSMLMDINASGSSDAGKYGLVPSGSYLYFAADDGINGAELWKTNGTTTSMVQDINLGTNGSEPQNMYDLNGTLYFIANNNSSTDNYELWKSTGSSASLVQDVQPSTVTDMPYIFGVYNNKVYFYANNGTTGSEPWSSDGTTTVLLKDLNPGAGVSSDPAGFDVASGKVYFLAHTSDVAPSGLHRSDGTLAGTVEIKPGGGANQFTITGPIKTVGTNMYFSASTLAEGNELWKSDGTAAGTILLKNIAPGNNSSDPSDFYAVGNTVYFLADDGTTGKELWKTDGTAAGTVLVKDVRSGLLSSNIRSMTGFINKVIFVADDGAIGEELWISDGTGTGTRLLKDVAPGPNSSSPQSLKVLNTQVGPRLVFSADDRSDLTGIGVGREIWTSDSTVAGTVLFNDLNPGTGSSDPSEFTLLGTYLYFSAHILNAPTLFRINMQTGAASEFYNVEFPFLLKNVGSKIVFFALPASSTNGFHLWSTDGTVANTTEIKDFFPGSLNYVPLSNFPGDSFPVIQNRMYMWLDNFISGQELWTTNGTNSGTIMYDLAAGPASSYPRYFKNVGSSVLFSANSGTITGRELWKVDVNVPIPVTGLDFNVRKSGASQIQLTWRTLSEFNNLGFEVQRSFDGVRFDSIGFVAAKGGNMIGASYGFSDTKQIDGRHYYRLMQIDTDKKIKYSDIRWADFQNNAAINVYPNPVRDVLNVNIGFNLQKSDLIIRTINGQLVKKQTVSGNGTIAIPISDIAAGVYSLEISTPGQPFKFMFVKQ